MPTLQEESRQINRTLGFALFAVGTLLAAMAVSIFPAMPADDVPLWTMAAIAAVGIFVGTMGLRLARRA